jgi:predicted TIM-barrel fold metal-dependent hydrolase
LDEPKFRPLYQKMAEYDLPIWIHPATNPTLDMDVGVFSWPFETASAMYRLVMSEIFTEFPNIKFLTHHCGSMVPFLEKRIKWILALVYGKLHKIRNPVDHFRKFYNDTALYGNTEALMLAYKFFGADHILYGTDSPLGPRYGLTEETAASIERMDIPDEEKHKILTRNAVNLLSLAL